MPSFDTSSLAVPFGQATATLAARGQVQVANETCWVRVFNWVVMCPTATPRSSTTLVRSARVGAGPPVIVDGPGVGVFPSGTSWL